MFERSVLLSLQGRLVREDDRLIARRLTEIGARCCACYAAEVDAADALDVIAAAESEVAAALAVTVTVTSVVLVGAVETTVETTVVEVRPVIMSEHADVIAEGWNFVSAACVFNAVDAARGTRPSTVVKVSRFMFDAPAAGTIVVISVVAVVMGMVTEVVVVVVANWDDSRDVQKGCRLEALMVEVAEATSHA